MWRGLKRNLGLCRKDRGRLRRRISDSCSSLQARRSQGVASGAKARYFVGVDGGAEAPPFRVRKVRTENCPRNEGLAGVGIGDDPIAAGLEKFQADGET